jgi:hypothetical protein
MERSGSRVKCGRAGEVGIGQRRADHMRRMGRRVSSIVISVHGYKQPKGIYSSLILNSNEFSHE